LSEPEGYVDGFDWIRFDTTYKVDLIKGTLEEVNRQGLKTILSADFYINVLNDIYADPNNLVMSYADAMSLVGVSRGDFKEVVKNE